MTTPDSLAQSPSLHICGQYSADCKQRTRWRIWRTTSLILCFLVNLEGLKEESSLTQSRKNKVKHFLLRISQQNNFAFENVYLEKTKSICFVMQFFWINEEISHQTLTAHLGMGNGTIQRHWAEVCLVYIQIVQTFELQLQSLLSEVWWAFFYLHGSFSSW